MEEKEIKASLKELSEILDEASEALGELKKEISPETPENLIITQRLKDVAEYTSEQVKMTYNHF